MYSSNVGVRAMLPFFPPPTPSPQASAQQLSVPQDFRNFRFTRVALVLALSAMVACSGILMLGPQITVIVPVALILGIFFAVRRSFGSLICFGYPLTFGLISAWVGCKEIPGYGITFEFFIVSGIGLTACVLIAVGLWQTLPAGKS